MADETLTDLYSKITSMEADTLTQLKTLGDKFQADVKALVGPLNTAPTAGSNTTARSYLTRVGDLVTSLFTNELPQILAQYGVPAAPAATPTGTGSVSS